MATETGAVTIKILSEGTDLGNPGVSALTVVHGANTISSAELVIDDGDAAKAEFEISNDPNFAPGKELTIELGHGTKTDILFKGIVVRHQIRAGRFGQSRLQLELKHTAVKMAQARKVKYFLEMDDASISDELIANYGLESEIDSGMDLEHERMVQYNVSDWDFLVTRAEANGCVVYTNLAGIVVAAPKVESSEGTPTAIFGINIWEIEAETEGRDQFAAGSAISWDPSVLELEDQPAESPSDVPDTGKPTADNMANSLGEGEFQLRHPGDLSDTEIINWSSARLMRSRLSKIRGRIKLEGSLEYAVGGSLILDGLSDVFNGATYIGGIQHNVKNGAWTTQVQVGLHQESYLVTKTNAIEPPVSGLIPPIRGLHIGTVREVEEDPGGLFRALVKIPVIDDDEDGYWCRVMHPDAGQGHTLFFQPQVGDEVIVGFLNEDPRQAIVLGSMHNNGDNEPPITDNDAYIKKGIMTVEGLSLIFNDEDKSIVLETPAGKTIVMDENEGVLLLEDENGNKVEMTSDGITMESAGDINIKAAGDVNVEGLNISQAANAQFKAEGSAGLEVSSPAITTIKGALVKIN